MGGPLRADPKPLNPIPRPGYGLGFRVLRFRVVQLVEGETFPNSAGPGNC